MLDTIAKFRGAGAARPARARAATIALAGLGGFVAMGALALLGNGLGLNLLLGSFGASCVLVFGFPEAPFSQPANVIGGHLLCALIGLAMLHACGPHWWALAFAVAVSTMAMIATRTTHPPAGSNPVIIFLTRPDWGFLLFPVLAGALALVLIALWYNNVVRARRYPQYW